MASIPNLLLHDGTDRTKIDAHHVVTTWLLNLQSTVASGDVSHLSDLFLDDSWWRDVLSLSWHFKSLHGKDIASCIKEAHHVGLTELKPAATGTLIPQVAEMGP
jgi:hypothetical protein